MGRVCHLCDWAGNWKASVSSPGKWGNTVGAVCQLRKVPHVAPAPSGELRASGLSLRGTHDGLWGRGGRVWEEEEGVCHQLMS